MAEPIKLLFWMWTPRKHVLDGVHIGATWWKDWTVHVRWRCSLLVKLLWPFVFITIIIKESPHDDDSGTLTWWWVVHWLNWKN